MQRLAFVAVVLAACLGFAAPVAAVGPAPRIEFHQRTLANGLRVITSPNRGSANVAVEVWYDVGARNDPAGRSGFAHMFEHMMLKGTASTPSDFINQLVEATGGWNNASTADEATWYYEEVAASQLERLLWFEANRMGSLVVNDAHFHSEREVVKEELRQRVLSDPYGRFWRYVIPEATFTQRPYRRNAIGSMEDLDAANLGELQAFHAAYYRPSNAVLVVVGAFDPARLDAWIDRYFGPLKNPAEPLPPEPPPEPARTHMSSVTAYAPNVPLPAAALTWLAPPLTDADAPALYLLDTILSSGRSSRLYDGLVYEQRVASQIFSNVDLRHRVGLFQVDAYAAQGHTADELIAALRAEVARLRDQPVSAAELEAAKTKLIAYTLRRRETVDQVAGQLGQAAVIEGDADRVNVDIELWRKVTAADLMRVARKYLADDVRAEVRYLQQPAAAETGAADAPTADAGPAPAAEPAAPIVPPAGAPGTPVLPTAVSRALPNGLRVIVARSGTVPLVRAQLTVTTGSEADPAGLSGAAYFTAVMTPMGAGGRSAREIAREAEALGAELTATGGWEAATVTLSVLHDKLAAALPIMAAVALRPAFAADEVERMRKQLLDGLVGAYGDPQQLSALAASPVAYAGTPFGHAQGGSPTSLKRIQAADLARFHAAYWRPDNAILVLTGDISPEEGFAIARRTFGGWRRPDGPPPAPPTAHATATSRAIAVDLPGAGQASVQVIWPAVPRTDPTYYAGLVANAVLGEGFTARLNQEIRVKRGLSYWVESTLTGRRTLGAFIADAQTRHDAAGQVATLIEAQAQALADTPMATDDLAGHKATLVGDFYTGIETSEALTNVISSLALYGIDPNELRHRAARVDAVTAADVQAFARARLGPERANVVVVGDGAAMLPTLRPALPGLSVVPVDRFDPDSPTLTAP